MFFFFKKDHREITQPAVLKKNALVIFSSLMNVICMYIIYESACLLDTYESQQIQGFFESNF